MDVILGFLYIVLVIASTLLLSAKFNWSKALSMGDFFVYLFVLVFSIFFFIFYFLGLINIITNQLKISITNALLLAIITTIPLAFIRTKPGDKNNCFHSSIFKKQQPLSLQIKFVKYFTFCSYIILTGLLLLDFPRGFEVRAYHLPLAINIFQNGSLQVWDHAYMHTFPANMSIWDGFWLQVFPERLVSIVNLPYLALCVFFLYQLCRLTGADRSASWLVSCGLTSIPLFSFSALELGADIAGVAFIIASTYLVLTKPNTKPDWSFMSGLSAGLAYGFKSSHLIPVALLAIFILISKNTSSTSNFLDKSKQISKFSIGFLLIAGVWLFRNYFELKNPTYPIHFGPLWNALGFKAAPDFIIGDRANTQFEWVHASWEWLVYPWVEWHYIGQNYKHSSGLGAFFAATVPASWLGFTILLLTSQWRTKKEQLGKVAVSLYLLGTLLVTIWWFLGDRQPRYVMTGITLLLPIAALLITGANKKLRKLYEFILIIGICFMLIVPIVRLGITQAGSLTSEGLASRSMTMEYPQLIDKLEPGSTILNFDDRHSHYALYGEKLSNHVVSKPEAERLFRQNNSWNLNISLIRQLGITHIYSQGEPSLTANCVKIEAIDRLDHNPFNGLKLDLARILYRIIDNCP